MTFPDLQTVPTPALLLDRHCLERNLARMNAQVARLGARLRPHVKTHKCPQIARQQVTGHFGGITISTLAEGFAFAEAGFDDLLYAVPVEPGKFERLCQLARQVRRLAVLIDDPVLPPLLSAAAEAAGVSLEVFIEIDCGDRRTGVPHHNFERIEQVARAVATAKCLTLAGILTHAGQSYAARTATARRMMAHHERDCVMEVAARLEQRGFAVPCISLGSTPTVVALDEPLPPNAEVRPGNYVFFDAFQAQCGVCAFEDCALTVLTAVVHRGEGKVVVDAGAIALSKDIGAADFFPSGGYALVGDMAGQLLGLQVAAVSQEHGRIPVSDPALLERLTIGTRLRLAVNHSCLTAAQHAHYWVVAGQTIVARWPIVQGW